jgi:hypothetical protein
MPLRWGSDAMIYIPSFIQIDSGMQKLVGWIHRNTHHIAIK